MTNHLTQENFDDLHLRCSTFAAEKADLQAKLTATEARLAHLEALCERLKLEAQMHAQEARTQRATVHECYQAVGAQKGDWNGAEPVRAKVAHLEAENQKLKEELARWKVCTLCGETMAEPGACSSAERERKEGYESMYDQMLEQAQAAESCLSSLHQQISTLVEEMRSDAELWMDATGGVSQSKGQHRNFVNWIRSYANRLLVLAASVKDQRPERKTEA